MADYSALADRVSAAAAAFDRHTAGEACLALIDRVRADTTPPPAGPAGTDTVIPPK